MTDKNTMITVPLGADTDIVVVQGHPICFFRVRRGKVCHTYPWIHWQGEWRAIKTDPHPTATFPAKTLNALVAALVASPQEYLWKKVAQP